MATKRRIQKKRVALSQEAYAATLNHLLFDNNIAIAFGFTELGRLFTNPLTTGPISIYRQLWFGRYHLSPGGALERLRSDADPDTAIVYAFRATNKQKRRLVVISEVMAEELIWTKIPLAEILSETNNPERILKMFYRVYCGFTTSIVERSVRRLRRFFDAYGGDDEDDRLQEIRKEYFVAKTSNYHRLHRLYHARYRLIEEHADLKIDERLRDAAPTRFECRLVRSELRMMKWRNGVTRRDYRSIRNGLDDLRDKLPRPVVDSYWRLGLFYLLSASAESTLFDRVYRFWEYILKRNSKKPRTLMNVSRVFADVYALNLSRVDRWAETAEMSAMLSQRKLLGGTTSDLRRVLETYSVLARQRAVDCNADDAVASRFKRVADAVLRYASTSRQVETCLGFVDADDDNRELERLESRLAARLEENPFDAVAFGLLVDRLPGSSLVEGLIRNHPAHERVATWCRWKYKTEEGKADFLLEVVLDFLDYNSNKENPVAWTVLNDLLYDRSVSMENVDRLWSCRSDWWPAYHLTERTNRHFYRLKKRAVKKMARASSKFSS